MSLRRRIWLCGVFFFAGRILVEAAEEDATIGTVVEPRTSTNAFNTAMYAMADDYPYLCKCIPTESGSKTGTCAHDKTQGCLVLPGGASKMAVLSFLTPALAVWLLALQLA
eukprot:TRINITY_DN32166_c0_g1_i1.p2 TRINITY_DN32166_c0_g1~~TRINITY_DN32166_c0_g1_i1.p2  ORF type:complete len:111 (+),score=24.46 TRINITY_DN32166_c0_g1_i1:159-491(+)